ncbi:MAG: HEAT repeat domain-containing protein [Candidatus Latescibacterota bacterium]
MSEHPFHVYITVGDYQWNMDGFPMDSAESIDALFEWMAKTYDVNRVYWRGEQDRIWLQNYVSRRENPFYCNIWDWLRHLNETVKTNDLALAAAHRHGVEIYAVEGLFEHTAQGDTGGVGFFPYPNEDRLRIEHPEWVPVDRWGERLAPGPIEFCYPEARQAMVERFVHHVTHYGYDGIAFYTYVENMGIRYLEEFGFNEPIVQEFKRRYGVDIRTEPFDHEAWARLRGEYVTQFLRELHTALSEKGKRLAVAVAGDNPDLPGPWGGMEIPGAGMIHLDWEAWVREGVVDELLGWFWKPSHEQLLHRLLEVCRDKPVELTTRGDHTDPAWAPYLRAGIKVAHGAWYSGMTRFARESADLDDLKNPDWRFRAQALLDIADGTLQSDGMMVAGLASDPHVLVRREVLRTLAALNATDQLSVIEAALDDEEPGVHFAAVDALAKVNGPETAHHLLAVLEKHDMAKTREACVIALQAMLAQAESVMIDGTKAARYPVREVSVRSLEKSTSPDSQAALLSVLREDEDYRVRFWATRGLSTRYEPEVIQALLAALNDPEPTVQLGAASALGNLAPALSEEQRNEALSVLERFFCQYGDGCQRTDAAWGWRVVGNAITAFEPLGKERLEAMRTQKRDKWLAWAAYQVVHVPQIVDNYILCEEQEAVETHRTYAPPFPGHRQSWSFS